MGSPAVVPQPPIGYAVDPKTPTPPPGYALDSRTPAKPSVLSQSVNTATAANAPLSSDIDDRRTPTISGKLAEWSDRAGKAWEEIKREASPASSTKPVVVVPTDTSFYKPGNDASRHQPRRSVKDTPFDNNLKISE